MTSDRRSPLVPSVILWLAFAVLVVVGAVTVAWPELAEEPEEPSSATDDGRPSGDADDRTSGAAAAQE